MTGYLKKAGIADVQASRVALAEEHKYVSGEQRFVGYAATIEFGLFLRDLDRVEEVLSGIVDAGVNRVLSVSFQTTQLQLHRADTRASAIQAAREKARVYAESSGVSLGAVLHIEDVNPDVLTGHAEGHHVTRIEPDEAPSGPIDPGAIVVGGAVRVCFAIVQNDD